MEQKLYAEEDHTHEWGKRKKKKGTRRLQQCADADQFFRVFIRCRHDTTAQTFGLFHLPTPRPPHAALGRQRQRGDEHKSKKKKKNIVNSLSLSLGAGGLRRDLTREKKVYEKGTFKNSNKAMAYRQKQGAIWVWTPE